MHNQSEKYVIPYVPVSISQQLILTQGIKCDLWSSREGKGDLSILQTGTWYLVTWYLDHYACIGIDSYTDTCQ